MDPFIDVTSERVVKAIDLNTKQELHEPTLPDIEQLVFQPVRRPLVTGSGDHVIVPEQDRSAISVKAGDTGEVLWTLPAGQYAGVWHVSGNVIVCEKKRTRKPTSRPIFELVALDATTRKRLWGCRVDDNDWFAGYGQGDRSLYLCDRGRIRALDVTTGLWAWERKLPRLRGHTSVKEEGGHVFVVCDYLSGPPTYFMYCLDAETGKTQWMYDPGGSLVRLPLLCHDGKVYTQIAPTRLMKEWRRRGAVDREGRALTTQKDLITRKLEGKSDAQIALILRSWHVLGDRSALLILPTVGQVVAGTRLSELPSQLMQSFPLVRNRLGLLEYLTEQFEANPDLRVEIRRILDDFDPVPYWYDHDEMGFPPRPTPKFPLAPDEQAVIDTYKTLKARADQVFFTKLDRHALEDLVRGRGKTTFDTLVKAYESASNAEHEQLVVAAMFKHLPNSSADWALERSGSLTFTDRGYWAIYATPEWIEAHLDVFNSWLRSSETAIQGAAGARLHTLDQTTATQICVNLLEEHAEVDHTAVATSLSYALGYLGRLQERKHLHVIEPYLESNAVTVQKSSFDGKESERPIYKVREAARHAHKRIVAASSGFTKYQLAVAGLSLALVAVLVSGVLLHRVRRSRVANPL